MKKNKSPRKNKGVTLIEVILTITLFSMVILAVTSAFYVGNRAWRKGIGQSNKGYKVYFALSKLSDLIKNGIFINTGYYSTWLKFEGTGESLTFAVLTEPKEETVASLDKVENLIQNTGGMDQITLSKDGSDIIKTKKTFADIINSEEGKKEKILSGVESLAFSYGYRDEATGSNEMQWKDNWEEADRAKDLWTIRIKVDYLDAEKLASITEDVFLPVAPQ